MRTFDFTPLFRSTVGFDHLAQMLDASSRVDEQAFAYPPYNIEKLGDDRYRITMAVAGFAESDLQITTQDHTLLISGTAQKEESAPQYLHHGIAGRSFERRFELADHIRPASASLVNGLLHVDLLREVPEALKPRSIPIAAAVENTEQPKILENKAA
ncbi:Hsp20 family protein [Telmatospirillum siberiense]|uniref:Heat-shock protein n=1 Tax=Telmatospirillum siberiense TaxID=382514 RepID=A0A2N3Q137_9PROT|nr:Hsp20 family protein [Telmatospirillum siberiense]PKU26369.1 heat-shock protein [Telmatospirillum siberiense]